MRRWGRGPGVAAALAVLLVACGDDGGGDAEGTTSTRPPPTTAPVSTTSLPTPLDLEVTENVRYHDDIEGYREPLLDVYAPTVGGPWPVVVMWHPGGGIFEDKDFWGLVAPQVAEQGAVVIAPTYGVNAPEDPFNVDDPDPDYFDVVAAERACVLAVVADRAEDYGGDPTDLVAVGSSAGASVAGETVWDDNDLDEGCVADGPPAVPRAVAPFEGDWLLAPVWDPVLASGELDYDESTVWDDLDRSAETDVHLLVGSEVSVNHRIPVGDPFDDEFCGRDIEPGTGVVQPRGAWCRWWELRDPDGEFRRDARRLGLFDDGWFDAAEFSLLVADRLEAQDQDPTVTTIEGVSHSLTRDDVTRLAPALIDIVRD